MLLCCLPACLLAHLPACKQPYSVPRMQRLVAVALATCNSVYVIVVICSGLVFGADLEADVLANVNSAAMAPLIGPAAAQVMAALVRVGYLLSLTGSYVLLCYPLRQVGRPCGCSRMAEWGWHGSVLKSCSADLLVGSAEMHAIDAQSHSQQEREMHSICLPVSKVLRSPRC